MKSTPSALADMLRSIADKIEQLPIDEIDMKRFKKCLGTRQASDPLSKYQMHDGTFSIDIKAVASLSFTQYLDMELRITNSIRSNS